jgi:hypothetical protein
MRNKTLGAGPLPTVFALLAGGTSPFANTDLDKSLGAHNYTKGLYKAALATVL